MENALKEAEDQIVRNKYGSRLVYEGYNSILQYAMVFCDKKCMIEKVSDN